MPLVAKVTLKRANFTEPQIVANLNDLGIKGLPKVVAYGHVSDQEC